MAALKILIANRGEIALRVSRTARRLGHATVAVYSTADARAAHVDAADEAIWVGAAAAEHSYLAIDKIVAAAQQSGADAIHPGYGFLAENADFARACAAADITFIGPPAAAIELMGNKRAAKIAMAEAGVGCIPGYQGEDQSDDRLLREADEIGFPIMVKAAAGGGGKGMRRVAARAELADALRAARAESMSAFASAELILEKAVVGARHVEIQVFADDHGNVVHLGERDCSIQRRHQKVIEESPSPAVDADLRQRMGAQAVAATRACGYRGAGTVEFLLDREGQFYFLEMNTRLQVEHPVTELVTGTDLVEWQILVAQGEPLPLAQEQIEMRGHAIEARIYAEDPARDYLPQSGQVLAWRVPTSSAVRVDHGLSENSHVSPYYDPLLAKVIAHGADRDQARRKLAAALRDTTLFGVVSNKSFLAEVCASSLFAEGGATTEFLTDHFKSASPPHPDSNGFAIAALMVFLASARRVALPDDSFVGWRSGGPVWVTITLECNDAEVSFQVTATGRGLVGYRYGFRRASEAGVETESVDIEVVEQTPTEVVLIVDGVRRRLRWAIAGDHVWVDDGASVRDYHNVTHRAARGADRVGSGRLLAPLDGAVMELFAAAGDLVEPGQLILVIEAMKMEHRVLADVAGTVAAITVGAGDQVRARQLLVEIDAQEGEA
jgi:geranyl-CoA carboxylase alpha subunit